MNRDGRPAPPRQAHLDPTSADSSDGRAAGLYLRAINRIAPLGERAQSELAAQLRQGDPNGREQALRAHLGLVVDLARSYEAAGLPLLDLISEGNLGLLEAIKGFDNAIGRTLATHAAQGIARAIEQALAHQSRTPSSQRTVPG